ncbi:unnamed protein product [Orchesella dallaii]|uniref:Centrosomal protein of 76 kDa n=1 Tax=Orchesella dallaii TaxID=48710 RepID=A0ABP1RTT5_9HEXA
MIDSPAETDEALRKKLRNQLEKSGISTAVRKMVRKICDAKDDVNSINPDEVITEVYRKGLMDTFMENLDRENSNGNQRKESLGLLKTSENGNSEQNSDSDIIVETGKDWGFGNCENSSDSDLVQHTLRKSGKYYLKMEIRGGKAFLDHLLDESRSDDVASENNMNVKNEFRAKLVLHVFYKSLRFTAKPVECRCDPDFKDIFLIDIGRFDHRGGGDGSVASQILSINEPLRIMVVREDVNLHVLGGSLVAYCAHDWRSILVTENGLKNFPLELMGIGPEHNVCVGILQVRLSLVPIPHERISESTYLDKVNHAGASHEDRERNFIATVKRWWKEYIEIRADHQLRLIRLFAYDEKMVAKPVMAFVKPVQLDDLLGTPFNAAWFVSLLPLNGNQHTNCSGTTGYKFLPGIQNGIGGCFLSERWQNVETTIISKSGTVEDHAVLLTSLLLSFGLDAYVALGTKRGKGSWAWTVTLSENQEPTFWESTTGDYYDHYSYPEGYLGSNNDLAHEIEEKLAKNKTYNFLTVSCIFNDKELYANVQPTISVDFVDWNIGNTSKWKRLPYHQDYKQSTSSYPFHLNRSTLNWDFIAKKLEFQLKNLLSFARKEQSLGTSWDDVLPPYMGQHLTREELEVSTCGKDFKDHFKTVALKNLPPGYDFRAHTFNSQTVEAYKLFESALREPLADGIIFIRGDDVRHSLKVKIFPYPEDVPSVRFMIACRYIPTS